MSTWTKPVIRTMDEQELLKQLAVKASTGGIHTDSHTDSISSD